MSQKKVTYGVQTWATGDPFTRIECSQGHKRRLIDRMQWMPTQSYGEQLYNAGYRSSELGHPEERSSPAELSPITDIYKWRLACQCGLNVVMTSDTLQKIAKVFHDGGVKRVELSVVAAIVSSSSS